MDPYGNAPAPSMMYLGEIAPEATKVTLTK